MEGNRDVSLRRGASCEIEFNKCVGRCRPRGFRNLAEGFRGEEVKMKGIGREVKMKGVGREVKMNSKEGGGIFVG